MKYKPEFEDYVPEKELMPFDPTKIPAETILEIAWKRIRERYPKHKEYWDEIYEQVADDYYRNYTCETTIKVIKRRKKGGE